MPRRTPQIQGDQPLQADLDTGFVGWNDRLDPSLLRSGAGFSNGQEPAGLVSAAFNNRFVSSQAETRPGSVMPVHFNPTFTGRGLLGAGIYSDPNGIEWMALATETMVWLVADRASPYQIALPAGVQFIGPVEFTQAFGDLILWRGLTLDPLHWNGDKTRPFYYGQNPPPDLTNPDAPRFIKPTPPGEYGIVAADRLWVVTDRDTIQWSDIQDYNAFDPTLNSARLNSGEDDAISAILFLEDKIIVWKTQSIFVLSGITGDLAGLAAQQISRNVGCIARRSVAQVGSDVLWLAEGGVYRLSQSFETRLLSNAVPLSNDIENTMRRINWIAASAACGTVHGRYYHLAVPLDNSAVNNAILVYDTVSGYWQGIDTWTDPNMGMNIRQFLQTDLFGRRVPFAIDGYRKEGFPSASGRVIALDQPGLCDRRFRKDGTHFQLDISWSITTRGYTLGDTAIKKLRNVTIAMGTQGAETRISLVGEGPGESRVLLDWRTYSRTKYTKHGFTDFVTTNTTDTFSAPYREDYTLVCGDGTQLRSGLPLSAMQHWLQSLPLRQEVRWMAFKIESRKGRCLLKTVSADGLGDNNTLTRRN
jgi:hypothetical protein